MGKKKKNLTTWSQKNENHLQNALILSLKAFGNQVQMHSEVIYQTGESPGR